MTTPTAKSKRDGHPREEKARAQGEKERGEVAGRDGRTEQRSCAGCGAQFAVELSFAAGRPRRFCEACRPSGPRERPGQRSCGYCGAPFQPKTRRAVFCSPACKYRARDGVVPAGTVVETHCLECDTPFRYVYAGVGRRPAVCGDACRAERARRALDATHAQQATGRWRGCSVCGTPLRRSKRQTCSPECAAEHRRRTRHDARRRAARTSDGRDG